MARNAEPGNAASAPAQKAKRRRRMIAPSDRGEG
jgi:hypothetical protein